MSKWSLVSGKSSKAYDSSSNKSGNDFTIVNRHSESSGPVEPAEVGNNVRKWLGAHWRDMCTNTSNIKEPGNGLTTPSKPKAKESESQSQLGNISHNIPDNPKPILTPDTTPTPKPLIPDLKIYAIKISILQKLPSSRNPSYFSISRHPSTRYSTSCWQRIPLQSVAWHLHKHQTSPEEPWAQGYARGNLMGECLQYHCRTARLLERCRRSSLEETPQTRCIGIGFGLYGLDQGQSWTTLDEEI
jgi:hypothetical protein